MESVERYEQKYLVSIADVERIERSICPFVRADSFSNTGYYQVLSLYLDGVDRPLYQATYDQSSARLKLRIRTYGGADIFLEVKRKIRGMVWKSRVKLTHQQYNSILGQRYTMMSRAQRRDLLSGLPSNQSATLDEFLWWRDRYQATPHYWVGYERRGFESPDGDYARVTFDYRVKALATIDYRIPADLNEQYTHTWRRLDFATELKNMNADVIMELKSERRVPMWMSTLCQRYDLSAIGVSKYQLAVERSDAVLSRYRTTLQKSSRASRAKSHES